MKCDFYVGQKVSCIDDDVKDWKKFFKFPLNKGNIYTIRCVLLDSDSIPCVHLEEIEGYFNEKGYEYAYLHTRFIPLDNYRKTIHNFMEEFHKFAFKDLIATEDNPYEEVLLYSKEGC